MTINNRTVMSRVFLVTAAVLAGCSDDESAQSDSTSSTKSELEVISVSSLKEQTAGSEWIIEGAVSMDESGSTRMCASVLEPDPPQCGTPEVFLHDLPANIEFTEVTVEGRGPLADLRLHVQLEGDDSARVLEVLETVSVDGTTPEATG